MLRKKLWYVPGLYSLLGLPILLLLMGPEEVKEKVSLRLFVPDDRPYKGESIRFTTQGVIDYASTKKITVIRLDADYLAAMEEHSAYYKPGFITREIERLAYIRDTSVALRIDLREETTYREFVWLLNQMIIHNIRRYALAGNSFYVFPNPIFEYQQQKPLPLDADGYTISPYAGPSWWERFQWEFEYGIEYWSYYIRHNYILVGGFILFIFIPFIFRLRKIRRMLPSRQYPLQS